VTRIFISVKEAINEVGRDLAEMGIRVHPKTCQDKDVSQDKGYDTLELQNYTYTVIIPVSESIRSDVVQPYCDVEWGEREEGLEGCPINPGESWKTRPEVWKAMLEKDGTFAYTYPERFAQYNQIEEVISRLKEDPDSRQLYISIWDPEDITKIGGRSRIPCSLGYLVQCREGRLDLTYLQRSCDFATHMKNDIFFAIKLQEYLANRSGIPVGKFTHWLGSLHVFQKDVEEVF
jgi:hypothetical protein